MHSNMINTSAHFVIIAESIAELTVNNLSKLVPRVIQRSKTSLKLSKQRDAHQSTYLKNKRIIFTVLIFSRSNTFCKKPVADHLKSLIVNILLNFESFA